MIILRQVVLGASDVEVTGKQLRETFGLAPGFADPILEDIGMADETIRVGEEAHLEVVGPLREDTSIAAWIRKGGSGGGYGLSIQVSSVQEYVDRAVELGVRIAADMEVYGHRIVQLHPGDMGLLIELDEIADPSVWFWDSIPRVAPPAPLVDDVLGVTVSSPDPVAQARLWGGVFGADTSGGTLALGSRTVSFAAGPRKMLSAVSLRAVGASGWSPLDLGGVRFTAG
ncbi:hypothetical protein [Cryptosporangium phraense]|uniref:VOC domain-containing protein n=1 Tax=Cryptosporangium phraense TaxID=2593070 RepID=A0A545AKT5_9ACTN|nr:hypothetical protein [Cryptosporangium phraense]TQS41936.1 hypothetical protein FL583_27025 [Cryptosporangium phraense]